MCDDFEPKVTPREGFVTYRGAIKLMRRYKKNLDKEEARLKTESKQSLAEKLNVIRLRRKAIRRRRLLLQTDVETYRVPVEMARRLKENPEDPDLDVEDFVWAETNYQLPEASVKSLLAKIDELLPFAAKTTSQNSALDSLADEMLLFN